MRKCIASTWNAGTAVVMMMSEMVKFGLGDFGKVTYLLRSQFSPLLMELVS